MTDHTVKSFTEQLEGLSSLVAQMGGMAEAQFAAAIEAIAQRNSSAAETVGEISVAENRGFSSPSAGAVEDAPLASVEVIFRSSFW